MALVTITATEFQQNVGRYQDAAQRAPVEITRNGRPHTVMMSAALFEVLTKGRIARRIEDLDAETADAVLQSSVASDRAAPDSVLDDWKS